MLVARYPSQCQEHLTQGCKMALLLLLVALAVWLFYLGSRKPKGFPPGPLRLPVVGIMPLLNHFRSHKQLWAMSAKYGGVMGTFFGCHPVVVVCGWDNVRESLTNEDLNGRPKSVIFKLRSGEDQPLGIIMTEGNVWKTQRRFTIHNFRNLGLGRRSHEAIILEEAESLLSDLISQDTSSSLQTLVSVTSVSILWTMIGGSRLPRDSPELRSIIVHLEECFRAGELTGLLVEAFPFMRHFYSLNSPVLKAQIMIQSFIKRAVDVHKTQNKPGNHYDFIDLYLKKLREPEVDPSFTEKQLLALCTDVFAAGADTGSSFLSFAVLMTIITPGVQEHLHQELDQVIGRDRFPCMNDKNKLVYTEAVMNEVFRFRGPVPLPVPHCATKDTTLKGYNVLAGTMVLNNLYSVMMDPEYWGDPDVFRPERFILPDGSLKKEERLIPFGKGKRVCLGESLARMTGFLLFTSLMQRCSFSLDPLYPLSDTEGKDGFTLAAPDFRVFVKPRY